MTENFDEYVTLRCNECGEEIGFFPLRVVYLRGCECGNDDYGSARYWKDDKFGNFTLVKKEELVFQIRWPDWDTKMGQLSPEWETPTTLHKDGRAWTTPRVVAYQLLHDYSWMGYEAVDSEGNIVILQDDLPTEIWLKKI